MGSLFSKKAKSKEESVFESQFNGFRGILWNQKPGVGIVSFEEGPGMISFHNASVVEFILATGDLTLRGSLESLTYFIDGSFFMGKTDSEAQSRTAQVTSRVYQLFLTSIWDIIETRFRNPKVTSLIIDALFIPLMKKPLDGSCPFFVYKVIDPSLTGPKDRVWTCCRQCFDQLGPGTSEDIISAHLQLTQDFICHRKMVAQLASTLK